MNLFIGVILDGFDAASASDHDVIKQEDFARFASHWAEFDPRATCLISVQVYDGAWCFGINTESLSRSWTLMGVLSPFPITELCEKPTLSPGGCHPSTCDSFAQTFL